MKISEPTIGEYSAKKKYYIFPKNSNFDNFFPKKCNFEKFSTSESGKYGESFSQFFCQQGKNLFFWQNIHQCRTSVAPFIYVADQSFRILGP